MLATWSIVVRTHWKRCALCAEITIATVGHQEDIEPTRSVSLGERGAVAVAIGIALEPESVGNVTTTMLVGQAVAQTPSIFGLLVSFILMFKAFPESTALKDAMALLSAGLCMGFGGIGPGIGNGMAAEGAVRRSVTVLPAPQFDVFTEIVAVPVVAPVIVVLVRFCQTVPPPTNPLVIARLQDVELTITFATEAVQALPAASETCTVTACVPFG